MERSPIQRLIDEVGEPAAKIILRKFYAQPENIAAFGSLFPNHIQSDPAAFHLELYREYTKLNGMFGGAAPRGFSKSTITDLVFLAWVSLNLKRHFVLLISDTFTQATMLLEALKEEMEANGMIKWLYGDVRGREWSSESLVIWGVNEHGRREQMKIMAKGAGMKVRGNKFHNWRPDLILLDDLENDELVESAERRKKLKNWLLKGVLPALAKDIGCIIMIGTILHRDSLLSNIITGKDQFAGWRRLRYQAISNDGVSLWPDRFTVEYLVGMRDDPNHPLYLGPIAFSQEMQNIPISEEDQIIKSEWLNTPYSMADTMQKWCSQNGIQENMLTEWLAATFKHIFSAVDPAISEKTTADYWAEATVGIAKACPVCEGNPEGHILQLDMVRMRESDPLKQVGVVLDQHEQWHPDKVRVEAVAYQAGLATLTKNEGAKRSLYPPLHAFKPDKDKTRRAIIVSASFAGGLVHLRSDHPLYQLLKEEIESFPQAEHDDMFDALMSAMEDVTHRRRARTFENKPSGF
jgi:predicted phage terminase large subunit-like protein